PEIMLAKDILLIHRGNLAEQFVGQELLAYQRRWDQGELFYWERDRPGSSAEIDYIIHVDRHVVPIEVKAGRRGTLKSLHFIMQEKNIRYGIRIAQKPFSFKNNILSVPLYMIHKIPELVQELYTT